MPKDSRGRWTYEAVGTLLVTHVSVALLCVAAYAYRQNPSNTFIETLKEDVRREVPVGSRPSSASAFFQKRGLAFGTNEGNNVILGRVPDVDGGAYAKSSMTNVVCDVVVCFVFDEKNTLVETSIVGINEKGRGHASRTGTAGGGTLADSFTGEPEGEKRPASTATATSPATPPL